MFRKMRRQKQQMTTQEAETVLRCGNTGILAVAGDNDYPYTVPLNYVYVDQKIYFHCAGEGHKLDAIRRNNKVSFCVVEQDKIVPQIFATDYRSVVVFGKARILEEDTSRRKALEQLIDKYSPAFRSEGMEEIRREWNHVCLVEITPDCITGKVASQRVINAADK